MLRKAHIVDNYRYSLDREWAAGRKATFIMLNPSTADAEVDDPTIRRCIGFAQKFGCGSLSVVNLFAHRATDPEELKRAIDPIGPANNFHIVTAAREAHVVICAWGAHPFARRRAYEVAHHLRDHGVTLMCLKRTKDGHPSHPLYLPGAATLCPYASPAT